MGMDSPNLRGADQLANRIRKIRARYNVGEVTAELGQLMKRRILERFDKQVTPNLDPWKELAPSTLVRKNAEGFGDRPPLVRTEEMRDAIDVIPGGEGARYTNIGTGVRIGIEDPDVAVYAAVQTRGSNHVPARPFLGIGRSDVVAVETFLQRRSDAIEAGL